MREANIATASMETAATTTSENPPRPHPHSGARDEHGAWGYVMDPSPHHLLPPLVERKNCPGPPTLEGPGGRKVLEKIRGGLLRSQAMLQKHDGRSPRILCLVYTHQNAYARIQATADTWGRRCDGFLAASNQTNRSIGALDLPHAGPEAYGNMWQKIRSMWAYAYDHYLDRFDYFHICGDDTYVLVENLKAYALSLEQQAPPDTSEPWDVFVRQHWAEAKRWAGVRRRPLLLGMPHSGPTKKQGMFPDGGPGYTLNRAALQLFGERGLDSFLSNHTDPREDLFIGSFFASHGIWTSDTRDATGAWRYGGNGDAQETSLYDGVRGSSVAPKHLANRYPGYRYPPHLDGVSAQTVALHLKNAGKRARVNPSIPDLIRRYHAILYRNAECDANEDDDSVQLRGPGRPTGLRLVMLGDSVDRYQYLSLVYYLRWGRWFHGKTNREQGAPPTFRSYLFHEKDGGTWNDYMAASTKLLHPYGACDCYREGTKGAYEHNRTSENRFYYDKEQDNAVAFLWLPGRLPAQGHWEASTAFGKATEENASSKLTTTWQPFQWQYTTWSDLIRHYIPHLQPRPTWLYMNAHYWPNDFPSVGSSVAQAAAESGLTTIWSTATISNNFKAQVKLGGMDQQMCSLMHHCLNNSWMETNLTRHDMFDFFHFKPHVYKIMNKMLLEVMGKSVV